MVRRPSAAVVIALAVALAAAAVAGALLSPATSAQQTSQPPAVDNTVTRIELAPDGSARWTVTVRTRLATRSAVDQFETFQARFRENRSRYLGPFESRIRAVVAGAADATGREMSASEFAAETRIQEVPRRWGIVSYSFTWAGFAATNGDVVVVGDAFDGGFFIAGNDTLTVVAPSGYEVSRVEPAPTDRGERSVSWTGRVDFADGRPLVRAEPAGAESGGSNGPGSVTLPAAPTLIGAGVALLALLAGMAAVVRRRTRSGPAAVVEAELGKTDEERVLELLESRGGRVPQAAVGEAFDWSSSKTSRVLSRMSEEGTIEKLRLGRENLVRLPEDE